MAGFNFAPRGFAECDGQLLSISQNTALFSLLGTTYGGNGQSNFALPDLQGRVPIHFGQGPGLQNYSEGQTGGEDTHIIISSEMPSHSHGFTTFDSVSGNGNLKAPANNLPASVQGTNTNIYSNAASNATNTGMLAIGGAPHNNLQPYLVMQFCIAMQGVFPSRN
jgi:microcystin-dependent protein